MKYYLWARAKHRALKNGRKFTLEPTDIIIPEFCPVLGMRLKRGHYEPVDSSPSLDRIDNSGGYTKDNICVISQRANRIKHDATIDELYAVIEYMQVRGKQ